MSVLDVCCHCVVVFLSVNNQVFWANQLDLTLKNILMNILTLI